MPGQIGLVQAGEVLKIILGIGKPMIGKFLIYDIFEPAFSIINIERNRNCPLCGENPEIRDIKSNNGASYEDDAVCTI